MQSTTRAPYIMMAVVLAMYAVKVAAKLTIGHAVHSPVITGDGYHNASDILEALLVILTIVIARMPPNPEYRFGRRNVERIAELSIGILLTLAAAWIACTSIGALLREFLPDTFARIRAVVPFPVADPLVMGSEQLSWVVGVSGGSAIISFIVSRYEISVGRRTGHGSMIADGVETRSDGCIELAVCAGIIGEYAFGCAWLEYPLALAVAAFMAHTGIAIAGNGWGGLLQRSIGSAHEDAIRAHAAALPGVSAVTDIVTFTVGHAAVITMKLETRHGPDTIAHCKAELLAWLEQYLRAHDISESVRYVRFDAPPKHEHRVAYAVTVFNGAAAIAPTMGDATHVRICDIEDDCIVRWTDELLSFFGTPEDITAFLVKKRVRILRTLDTPAQRPIAAERCITAAGITHEHVASCAPETYGM